MSIRHEDLSVREVPVRQLLLADFSGSKPWRDVRSVRGMAHYSGKYASVTAGGHVVHESRLELARLLLADFDPEVRGIFAQPCRLTARVGDRVRHHVPDFPMAMRSGTVRVVNVKPADRLLDAKIAEALAWPGELFQQHGWATRSGPEPIVRCWRTFGSWPATGAPAQYPRTRWSGRGSRSWIARNWPWQNAGWPGVDPLNRQDRH